MRNFTILALLAGTLTLSACGGGQQFDDNDPNVDRGLDAHRLSDMRASIWVDPFGCQHWIIDDGIEGYLTNRLNYDGTPRCGAPQIVAGERAGSSQRLTREQ